MSCNGCRVLRKGCNETCILRQSLKGIESPQAQGNATLFVAKFFGRAGLVSFLSSVPESQRPALFQSLLTEACGRTINPVNGAVGLLATGNWHVCQSAVETVMMHGGVLRALPEFGGSSECNNNDTDLNLSLNGNRFEIDETSGLDIGFTASYSPKMTAGRRVKRKNEILRAVSPSNESETTLESDLLCQRNLQRYGNGNDKKLLKLFF